MQPTGELRALIVHRRAVRAILLTSAQEILLLKIRSPDTGEGFWIAPGGGLQPGESAEQALKRELHEELGLAVREVDPLVWRRQHTFTWDGRRICQREHYHVVNVTRFEPHMADLREARTLDRFRWWQVPELAQASERLTPLSLADIVARYLASGPPREPPAWEILVD